MRIKNDFDFTERELEQSEELTACAWAENNGWVVRKTAYIGRVGCPDRFFFGYGHIIPVEFKKPDKRNTKTHGLSRGQIEEHAELQAVGVTVAICFTADEAITLLKKYMPMEEYLV